MAVHQKQGSAQTHNSALVVGLLVAHTGMKMTKQGVMVGRVHSCRFECLLLAGTKWHVL